MYLMRKFKNGENVVVISKELDAEPIPDFAINNKPEKLTTEEENDKVDKEILKKRNQELFK